MAKKSKAQLTKFMKCERVKIHRRQIANAPYNPRKIVDSARKKLKENLEKVGLISPPVWNRTTGNLVAGHQRMSVIDALEGTQDYLIEVDAVDLDEKTEREQNIFMNNPSAQGDWDLPKLEEMLPNIGLEAAGLNLDDVYRVFGYTPLIGEPERLTALADQMRGIKDRHRKMQGTKPDRDDIGFYRVLVFENPTAARAWAESQGLSPDDAFLDGRRMRVTDEA